MYLFIAVCFWESVEIPSVAIRPGTSVAGTALPGVDVEFLIDTMTPASPPPGVPGLLRGTGRGTAGIPGGLSRESWRTRRCVRKVSTETRPSDALPSYRMAKSRLRLHIQ